MWLWHGNHSGSKGAAAGSCQSMMPTAGSLEEHPHCQVTRRVQNDVVQVKGKPRAARQTRGEEQQEATSALSSQQKRAGATGISASMAGSAWWWLVWQREAMSDESRAHSRDAVTLRDIYQSRGGGPSLPSSLPSSLLCPSCGINISGNYGQGTLSASQSPAPCDQEQSEVSAMGLGGNPPRTDTANLVIKIPGLF